MNFKGFRTLLVLLFLVTLAACDQPAATDPAASAPVPQPEPAAEAKAGDINKAEISWFEGSVEEAFALSKEKDTPLFLYWGAVWCPPCVEIKNTVFKSPRFIAMTDLFIPVYLDGDTERAQTWGDTFDAKVYPTMIIFNPDGEEVTRLHAGINISAYNTVLQLSLDSMRPTRELVEAALEDPSSLTDTELQQLGYHSWYDSRDLPQDLPAKMFLELSEAAGSTSPEAAARLYLQYVTALGENDELEGADPARIMAILSSPGLTFASWDYLITPESITPGLAGKEEEMAALKETWAATMHDGRHDERLSAKNQLYGWRPLLVFHFEGDEDKVKPLPVGVADAIRADVQAVDEGVAGSHSRQSAINTASNVFMLAGMTGDARTLLTAEIEKSKTPYYFMGSLAFLEEKEGNTAESLKWRQAAYESSEGPATRIRWWASYVQALVRLAPENSDTIIAASMYVFDQGQGMADIFSGANFRNLQRATVSLDEWDSEYHPDASKLTDFTAVLEIACARQEQDSQELASCSGLVQAVSSIGIM